MKGKRIVVMIVAIMMIGVFSACSSQSGSNASSKKSEVTIGYFPNVTHIATMIALEKGYFKDEFSDEVTIQTKTVPNGGLFMEAMATDEIDVGTIGPAPLISFYAKDPRYHIISGAVNGGAVLVAREQSGIKRLEDLDGKKVAIPVIGSTQDIMLRKALQDVKLKPTTSDGTVELFASAPADTATLFVQQSVDAAATQEPWGHVLETETNGDILLDWDEFAWGKESTNTVVAASESFLEHEELVNAYLRAHQQAIQFIEENPEESQELVVNHIKDLTGKEMDAKDVEAAFRRLEVTTAVNEQVLQEMATISEKAGYIPNDELEGLVKLSFLENLQQ
ncbi:MAG TPA: aliphatic sulfonate ABC transporter substrate-binding protein [Bacillota bacterium]